MTEEMLHVGGVDLIPPHDVTLCLIHKEFSRRHETLASSFHPCFVLSRRVFLCIRAAYLAFMFFPATALAPLER
jgi:hypothetical protein